MLVPDVCATLRFSTAGMPESARAQAVRDLHLHERTFLSAKLEPIEPLPDYPLHGAEGPSVRKRTVRNENMDGIPMISA
jgi:hypothetical protein